MGLGDSALSIVVSNVTQPRFARSIENRKADDPVGQDRGIGCERCHGPGLNHVKSVRSGYPELAIALTSKTPLRSG